MILATTEHHNILQERKIIPSERILILRDRLGAPSGSNFIMKERFLFPAERSSTLLESKFALTEYYNVLSD
jgi:hypothetical protein